MLLEPLATYCFPRVLGISGDGSAIRRTLSSAGETWRRRFVPRHYYDFLLARLGRYSIYNDEECTAVLRDAGMLRGALDGHWLEGGTGLTAYRSNGEVHLSICFKQQLEAPPNKKCIRAIIFPGPVPCCVRHLWSTRLGPASPQPLTTHASSANTPARYSSTLVNW